MAHEWVVWSPHLRGTRSVVAQLHRVIACLAVSMIAASACSSSSSSSTTTEAHAGQTDVSPPAVDASHPCGQPASRPVSFDHVIWIWMENKNGAIVPSGDAPYLTQLAAQCGRAADYVDNGIHPSLPNYLMATSGGDQGVHDDAGPDSHRLTADNIFRQVRAAGMTSRSYIETMPSPCATSGSHEYAVKHNPAAYYIGAGDRDACRRDDISLDAFEPDLASGSLANFVSISPNLCHDMHDCSVAQGDQWLSHVVPTILSSDLYRAGHTAVFIVWDESGGTGTMPFIAVSPMIAPGTVAQARLGHASLLAFTEGALGITGRLGAAADAADLRAAFGL